MRHEKQTKQEYIAYVLGKLETFAEGYAASAQLPFTELAGIISGFFHSKAGGQVLGHSNSVSPLPEQRGRVGRPRKEGRTSVAEMALSSVPHRGMSAQAKRKISDGMIMSWNRRKEAAVQKKKPVHWTQTPAGRKKMAARAKEFWKKGIWGKQAKS